MQIPSAVELETGRDPDCSVIWLHGLGADGHDFEPIVPELRLPAGMRVRFVFPHAPERPVTINGGMRMRAWYDILALDRNGPEDEAGVLESGRLLEQLIEREHQRGSDYARIVVAGFSQGGAIALHTALRFDQRLAGVMALSTYLPLSQGFATEAAARTAAPELAIFMAHGSLDPMLPIELGQSSRRLLEQAGYQVEWHEYAMAHSVCGEEIADIRRWLIEVLGPAR
ncbi:MAG TPA: alpha/beta fold hydrolase [Woeseiaceae bacterium]